VTVLALAALFLDPLRAGAADLPSQDACRVTGTAAPRGDCGSFKQIFREDFNGDSVPKGALSGCDHDGLNDTPAAYCSGLAGSARADWWAYPYGWADTAKSGADGNTGAPFGGIYDPAHTVWIGPYSGTNSDGVLHVDVYRPAAGGDNRVAAVVPRKCMAHRYGKYTERFRVTTGTVGFKSAHLFYQGGQEIDFPEGDWTKNLSGYVHPQGTFVNTPATWTAWHTTSIEWTPGTVRMYLDGKLVKTSKTAMPTASWVLQNESSIEGPHAAPGAKAKMATTWVTCYAYRP
jgi:hypothetical protein